MKKNDVLAALYTIGIIGVFGLVCWMIRDFPNLTWWVTTGLVSLLVFMVFIYPLWDTIKYELNERDKRKREAILKEIMKKDEECGLYDLDLDENDKAQIG
jgi:uncharacterized membrane protein